jgi:hypothetical protein
MASLHERIHKVKEELRKKGCNIEFYISELFKIDDEVKRAVKKRLHDPKFEFHFSSGDMRIIATTIRTKTTNSVKKLYYDTYGINSDDLVTEDGSINWNGYAETSQAKSDEVKLLAKLSQLHYMYSHNVFTLEVMELYIKNETLKNTLLSV